MRRVFLVPVFFIAVGLAAVSQPNFSGIWKLDPTKSDFGPQTVPNEAEYIVRHIGSKLSFNYIQDGNISRIDVTPDNEERITNTNEETAVWTRAYWSGNILVFEARERKRFGTQGATGANWTSRWTLSPSGSELIIDRVLRNGETEVVQHMVYSKQPLKPSQTSQQPSSSQP